MKVLLVEYKFHQEVLPAQLKFLLSAKNEVHLFLEYKLYDDFLLGPFRDVISLSLIKNSGKWYNKIKLLFLLRSYIKNNGITHLVFNTANSNFNAIIMRLIPSVKFIGIIHRVSTLKERKMMRSFVSRLDGVLTLSQQTLLNFKEAFPFKLNSSCFYPIFFEWQSDTSFGDFANQINVIIPGQFDIKKKDYQPLLDAATLIKERHLSIKFILLGDASGEDGKKIIADIERLHLQALFIYESKFIPYSVFFKWVYNADYVLPLFTRRVLNYENYLKSQISASFNWAFAFNKRLIIPKDFESMAYVSENAIFYSDADLIEKLVSLRKEDSRITINRDLSFSNQQRNYLKVF